MISSFPNDDDNDDVPDDESDDDNDDGARSTRTLLEYVRHDMIQSGRTCVQMTDHLMLLLDANTCRT